MPEPESSPAAAAEAPKPGWWKSSGRPALISTTAYCLARFIGATLRMRYENWKSVDEVSKQFNGAVLVTWHGRTLIPANIFRGRGYWALVSLSRDGELQDRIFRRFGYQTVRGSTGRGGVKAAIQLSRKINDGGVLAFTPDGPRGPTHKVQEGTIFFAQRSGRPIIPLGFSAKPRKLLGSWDTYMLPMPFGRGAAVAGEPIFVSADCTEEEKQEAARLIEEAINRCEARAEELAGW